MLQPDDDTMTVEFADGPKRAYGSWDTQDNKQRDMR